MNYELAGATIAGADFVFASFLALLCKLCLTLCSLIFCNVIASVAKQSSAET
jgi:hypothetical protein